MTTTENPDCIHANGPCDDLQCGEWKNPMGDPMVDWLTANGVDLDRIAMFPEIELLPGRMKIEYIYGLEDEPPRTKLLIRKPATRMVERPTPVPMPIELWEVYQRARQGYLAERALETLGRNGATVLSVDGGASLVFVTSGPVVEPDLLGRMVDQLERALPGVRITLMAGTETILHRPPQDPR